MATFTVELYKVAEMRGTIGLDDYPIFDEAYRAGLNKKIFDHYADYEIGQESVPRFLHAMSRKMNEIMPMYNQLYKSAQLVIDPLNTMSIKTVVEGESKQTASNTGTSNTTNAGTSDSEGTSSGVGQTVQSAFPQSQLRQDKDYATSGTDSTNKAAQATSGKEQSTSDNEQSGSSEAESTDKNNSTVSGWQGSQAMLLMQYRATFLNIDMDIIGDLAELFMFLWTNGDTYSQRRNGTIYT